MDLDNIGEVKDTTEVEIFDPRTQTPLINDDGTAMTVTVYGPYSAQQKAVRDNQQNRRIKRAQRTGGKLSLTAEEMYEDQTRLIVKCVQSWNIQRGGEKVDCTEENVRDVLDRYRWLREQLEVVIEDTSSFLET